MFQSRGGGSLPSLIRGLRAAQQEGTEDEFLSACLQQIKEDLLPPSPPAGARGGAGGSFSIVSRTPSPSARSTALLKLVYLQMLGFDVGFATFAVIEGMTVQSFTLKRPAYAAAALAFARPALPGGGRRELTWKAGGGGERGEEREEAEEQVAKNFAEEKSQQQQALSLLTTNLFKKDFNSKETHETSLALSTLSVMSTPEIANALLPDVLLLLSSSRPMLRKKAAVCCTRFLIQRQQLMVEEDPTVVSCLCSALLQLVERKPQQYLALAPPLFHLLCSSTSNWLSLKLLKTFGLLCPFEPRLPLKLLQPLLSLLQQSRAKSVEVEIIRLCLLHLPLQNAAETLAEARLSDASLAASAAGVLTEEMEDLSATFPSEAKNKTARGEAVASSADPAVVLLDLCVSKIAALLSSADRNLRYVGVDIMASLFLLRREFARVLAALIPNFQKHVLQAAEECDSTIRSRGVELLANTATAASFPSIAEQLVTAASSQERQHHRRSQQLTKQASSASGEASATTVAKIRADFLLPVLRLGAENHYALVEDFEWYLALLADIAVEGGTSSVLGCGAGGADSSSVAGWCSKEGYDAGGLDAEQQVSLLVAEQLLDITVRVPGVRPCSVHLCSLLLDAATPLVVSSLQNDSLEAVRRIHRSYRQQAGLHSPPVAADSELTSSASEGTQRTSDDSGVAGGGAGTSYVSPVIIRAAAWIVGEYFQCISNISDSGAMGDDASDLTFYVDACRSLMKLACGLHLPAPVQQVVISAAVKVFLGTSAAVAAASSKQKSGANAQLLRKVQQEMRVMLRRCRSNEAENTSVTNSVEVYDRVRLADQLLQFFGPNADPSTESFRVWSVRQENLLPVLPNAQQQVTMDPSLDLSVPFFDYRQLQSAHQSSSSCDSSGLVAASGNADTSPLNPGSPHKPWAAAPLQDATAGTPASKAPLPWSGSGRAPVSTKKKFEVIKGAIAPATKEVQSASDGAWNESKGSGFNASAPVSDATLPRGSGGSSGLSSAVVDRTVDSGSAQSTQRVLGPALTAMAASVPLPPAMQHQLQQRLWQRCAEDDTLRVFTCTGPAALPTAPDEPPALALYACCEKKVEQSVDVRGVGLAFDQAADLRLPPVVPVTKELKKRSNRVTLKLCSFQSPLCCTSTRYLGDWQLQGEVLYATSPLKPAPSVPQVDERRSAETEAERGAQPQARTLAFRLELPVTVALVPLEINEDQLASFLAQHASVISAQHSERVSVRPLRPLPQQASPSPAWSISIAGHSPASPIAVLQYLRVVAAAANMSLLPQQPIPVGHSGVLKCLFIARLYDPDAAAGTTDKLGALDGNQVVIAFVACQGTAGPSDEAAQSGSQKGEGQGCGPAVQDAGDCLQFRVNARSAGATCSQAVCHQLCRLIEETAAGRLHVFNA